MSALSPGHSSVPRDGGVSSTANNQEGPTTRTHSALLALPFDVLVVVCVYADPLEGSYFSRRLFHLCCESNTARVEQYRAASRTTARKRLDSGLVDAATGSAAGSMQATLRLTCRLLYDAVLEAEGEAQRNFTCWRSESLIPRWRRASLEGGDSISCRDAWEDLFVCFSRAVEWFSRDIVLEAVLQWDTTNYSENRHCSSLTETLVELLLRTRTPQGFVRTANLPPCWAGSWRSTFWYPWEHLYALLASWRKCSLKEGLGVVEADVQLGVAALPDESDDEDPFGMAGLFDDDELPLDEALKERCVERAREKHCTLPSARTVSSEEPLNAFSELCRVRNGVAVTPPAHLSPQLEDVFRRDVQLLLFESLIAGREKETPGLLRCSFRRVVEDINSDLVARNRGSIIGTSSTARYHPLQTARETVQVLLLNDRQLFWTALSSAQGFLEEGLREIVPYADYYFSLVVVPSSLIDFVFLHPSLAPTQLELENSFPLWSAAGKSILPCCPPTPNPKQAQRPFDHHFRTTIHRLDDAFFRSRQHRELLKRFLEAIRAKLLGLGDEDENEPVVDLLTGARLVTPVYLALHLFCFFVQRYTADLVRRGEATLLKVMCNTVVEISSSLGPHANRSNTTGALLLRELRRELLSSVASIATEDGNLMAFALKRCRSHNIIALLAVAGKELAGVACRPWCHKSDGEHSGKSQPFPPVWVMFFSPLQQFLFRPPPAGLGGLTKKALRYRQRVKEAFHARTQLLDLLEMLKPPTVRQHGTETLPCRNPGGRVAVLLEHPQHAFVFAFVISFLSQSAICSFALTSAGCHKYLLETVLPFRWSFPIDSGICTAAVLRCQQHLQRSLLTNMDFVKFSDRFLSKLLKALPQRNNSSFNIELTALDEEDSDKENEEEAVREQQLIQYSLPSKAMWNIGRSHDDEADNNNKEYLAIHANDRQKTGKRSSADESLHHQRLAEAEFLERAGSLFPRTVNRCLGLRRLCLKPVYLFCLPSDSFPQTRSNDACETVVTANVFRVGRFWFAPFLAPNICWYLSSINAIELILPPELTTLPDRCLANCYSIRSVTIVGTVDSIGDAVFPPGYLESGLVLCFDRLNGVRRVGDLFLTGARIKWLSLPPFEPETVVGHGFLSELTLDTADEASKTGHTLRTTTGPTAATAISSPLYDLPVDLSPLQNIVTVGHDAFCSLKDEDFANSILLNLCSLKSVGDNFFIGSALSSIAGTVFDPTACVEPIKLVGAALFCFTRLRVDTSHLSMRNLFALALNGRSKRTGSRSRDAGPLVGCQQIVHMDLNSFAAAAAASSMAAAPDGERWKLPLSLPRYFCAGLGFKEVDFAPLAPLRIDRIGQGLLSGCISLVKVLNLDTLVPSCADIPDDFLAGCPRLEHLALDGLCRARCIGKHFCMGCLSLKEVDLSQFSAVESVGAGFLAGCWSLENVNLEGFRHSLAQIGPSFLAYSQVKCSAAGLDLSPLCHIEKIPNYFLEYTFLEPPQVNLSGLRRVKVIDNRFLCHSNVETVDLSTWDALETIRDFFLDSTSLLRAVRFSPHCRITSIGRGFLQDVNHMADDQAGETVTTFDFDWSALRYVEDIPEYFMCVSLPSTVELWKLENLTAVGNYFLMFPPAGLHRKIHEETRGTIMSCNVQCVKHRLAAPFCSANSASSTTSDNGSEQQEWKMNLVACLPAFRRLTKIGDGFLTGRPLQETGEAVVDLSALNNITTIGGYFLSNTNICGVDWSSLRSLTHIGVRCLSFCLHMTQCVGLAELALSPEGSLTCIDEGFMLECLSFPTDEIFDPAVSELRQLEQSAVIQGSDFLQQNEGKTPFALYPLAWEFYLSVSAPPRNVRCYSSMPSCVSRSGGPSRGLSKAECYQPLAPYERHPSCGGCFEYDCDYDEGDEATPSPVDSEESLTSSTESTDVPVPFFSLVPSSSWFRPHIVVNEQEVLQLDRVAKFADFTYSVPVFNHGRYPQN